MNIILLLIISIFSFMPSLAIFQESGGENISNGTLTVQDGITVSNGNLSLDQGGQVVFTQLADGVSVAGSFDIADRLTIRGGNPLTGRVLASNANGLARWEDIENLIANAQDEFSDGGDVAPAARSFGNQNNQDMSLITNNIPRIVFQGPGEDTIVNPTNQIANFEVRTNAASNVLQSSAIVNNFGIGTADPQTKLHIDGGSNAQFFGGGFLILGDLADENIVFDDQGLIANDNNNFAELVIQEPGGDVRVGTDNGFGRLGVNVVAPTSTADIGGILRVRGGNPALNRILTATDALGNAEWQDAPEGEQGDQGIDGFPGNPGEQGDQGDKGAEGAAGPIAGCQVVATNSTTTSATANCPAGSTRVSGGVQCVVEPDSAANPPEFGINESRPQGSTGWRGGCTGPSGDLDIQVFAVCC